MKTLLMHIVCLTLILTASSSPVALSADEIPVQVVANGRIAFASNRDGDWEIFTINPDGSDLQQITFNTVYDGYPNWSPDGAKIAFVSDLSDKTQDIYLINADGSNLVNLTNTDAYYEGFPVWSPDGTKIAFERTKDESAGTDLYVMDVDGSDLTKVFGEDRERNIPSAWSPDSTQIAFATSGNIAPPYETVFGFSRIGIDGSNLQGLHYGGTDLQPPDWSPDGNRIMFANETGYIAIMNLDGSELTWITELGDYNSRPRWSPDGQQITYNHEHDIYVANVGGSNAINITDNGITYYDSDPDWQPVLVKGHPPLSDAGSDQSLTDSDGS